MGLGQSLFRCKDRVSQSRAPTSKTTGTEPPAGTVSSMDLEKSGLDERWSPVANAWRVAVPETGSPELLETVPWRM